MKSKHVTFLFFMGLFCGFFFLSACSEKTFNAAPGSVFQQCVDVRPEVRCQAVCDDNGQCVERFDYEISADGQITDILFVVDNSGSMSEEQEELGTKFPNFLKTLSGLDYRIAMTTTDISGPTNGPDKNNGNGAFQDGKLLPLTLNNQVLDLPYLNGSMSTTQEEEYFLDTITRKETKACEDDDFSANSCPSGDERGLLAASLTLKNNPADFIRPVGHMALVVISDEDEGSNGNLIADVEEPAQFVTHFRGLYPNKSLRAHSIIIEPDSERGKACFDENSNDDGPDGQYGRIYAELTRITNGYPGDLCANEYTTLLEKIGRSVAQKREVLPCSPINKEIDITFSPEPAFQVDFSFDPQQNEILFSEQLPKGTKIRFQFLCDRN